MTAPQGNLFARELQAILKAKDPGLRLGHLDDRGDEGKRIHPEKVARLQRSLETPGQFYTLNVDELENVIQTFDLEQDRLKLRAAILATDVERLLYNQGMTGVGALKAAEKVMPAILEVLQDISTSQELVGAFRDAGSEKGGMTMEEAQDAVLDSILESALQAIDRGILALHLVTHAQSRVEREGQAQEALSAFASALLQLHGTTQRIHADPTFLPAQAHVLERVEVWRREAESGMETARKYLQ
jgi:hypothetical protein